MSDSDGIDVVEIELESGASSEEIQEVLEFAEALENEGCRVLTDIEEAAE